MRLRLYEQLANALAARKAITDEFFVNELRVLLAQGRYMIFYCSCTLSYLMYQHTLRACPKGDSPYS